MANTVLKNGGAAYVPPDLLNDTSTPDLNPDYFDIVITDLKPDTDYAIQLAWVFEDKTLSPYSASYDLHTDAITIPEVTNIATEWSKNDLIITFDRPEETINGVITGLADSYILTLTYNGSEQKIPFNGNPLQTSQKYVLTQSKAEALWPSATPNQYTGLLQVINQDGTSSGVSFTTAALSDGITDQDIADSSWAISSILDGYIVSWAEFTDAGAKAIYDYTEVYQSTTSSGTYSLVEFGKSPLPHVYYADLGTKYIKIRHKTKRGTYSHYSNVKQIKSADPSGYDANGPTNTSVLAAGTPKIDDNGLFDFNYQVPFSWNENADTTTLGYKIRWRINGSSDPYTYMSVPGKSTTTANLFGVLAGKTYEVGLNVYDEYDNVTGTWSNTTVVVPAFDGSIKDTKYIKAGDMKLGYGIGPGGESNNKGLYLSTNNYWYIYGNTVTDNSAKIKIGSSTDYVSWNGTKLEVTGTINAKAGDFTGTVNVGSPTVAGQLRVVQSFDTDGTTPLKGIELGKFSSEVSTLSGVSHGIYAYDKGNAAKYVLIDATTGTLRAASVDLSGSLKTGTSTSYIHIGDTAGSIKFKVSGFTYPGQITYDSLYGSTIGSLIITPPTNSNTAGDTPFIMMDSFTSGGMTTIYSPSSIDIDASTLVFGNSGTDARFQGPVTFYSTAKTTASVPTYASAGGFFRNIYVSTASPGSAGNNGDVWITY